MDEEVTIEFMKDGVHNFRNITEKCFSESPQIKPCWWVVMYTDMVAKNEPFHIQEVFENFRLWAVSPHTISFCREIDLVPILGDQENMDEDLGLLSVILSHRLLA